MPPRRGVRHCSKEQRCRSWSQKILLLPIGHSVLLRDRPMDILSLPREIKTKVERENVVFSSLILFSEPPHRHSPAAAAGLTPVCSGLLASKNAPKMVHFLNRTWQLNRKLLMGNDLMEKRPKTCIPGVPQTTTCDPEIDCRPSKTHAMAILNGGFFPLSSVPTIRDAPPDVFALLLRKHARLLGCPSPGLAEFRTPWSGVLVWSDRIAVRGILEFFHLDQPGVAMAGEFRIAVDPCKQRRGIGTCLLLGAIKRWEIDFNAQIFTTAGRALAVSVTRKLAANKCKKK